MQVSLSNSQTSGEHLAICTDRGYLQNALRLGFREFNLFSNKSPALCDDGQRQYLWAILEPADIVKRGQHMTCLQSPLPKPRIARMKRPTTKEPLAEETPATAVATSPPPPKLPPSPAIAVTVAGKNEEQAKLVAGTPLAQALAMRAVLREALALNGRLIADIKRHKKQSRLVDSTLAALKQLREAA